MPINSDAPRVEVAAIFGRAVKVQRAKRGLTQRQLADAVNPYLPAWSQNTVAATEVGRREPSLSETLILASVFDCALTDLLPTGDEEVHLGPLPLSTAVRRLTETDAQRAFEIENQFDPETLEAYEELRREERGLSEKANALGIEYGPDVDHLDTRDLLASLPPLPEGPGDPDRGAAKKFGLSLGEMVDIATRHYGHSLYVERWKRECDAVLRRHLLPDEYRDLLPERTEKGLRIGISRKLLAEIEPEARALAAKKKGTGK
jgi:transcriptional regulator with XRE-family HTH domain